LEKKRKVTAPIKTQFSALFKYMRSAGLGECRKIPRLCPNSWTTVLAAYATWSALIAGKATWADVLNLVGDPSEVIVP